MSIKTNIRNAITTRLKLIIAGNDNGYGYTYNNTIRDNNINDRAKSPEQMREFPSINMGWGDELAANADVGKALQTGGNRQLLHNSTDFAFTCYLKDMDQSLAQENLLADIQAVMQDYTINDTVFNSVYYSSSPFGLDMDKPNCGIVIIFRIWYRIYQTNPNVTG